MSSDARTEGHRAYRNGKSKDQNPYAEKESEGPFNSTFIEKVEWDIGWEDAQAGIPPGK